MRAGRVGIEQLAGEGLRHETGHGIAVDRQPDQRSPHRQAGNEGARAVDRVDDPHMPTRHVLAAMLLPEDAMIGVFRRYQRANRPLGLTVGLRHRIETLRLLVGDCTLAAEARQGLGGGGTRDAPYEIDADIQLTLPVAAAIGNRFFLRHDAALGAPPVAPKSHLSHRNGICTSY